MLINGILDILITPFACLVLFVTPTSSSFITFTGNCMPQSKEFNKFQCPACDRFFSSQQGLSCHLSTAKSCLWYRKGKIRDLTDQVTNSKIHWRVAQSGHLSDSLKDHLSDLSDLEVVTFDDLQHEIPLSPIQDEFVLIPDLGAPGPGPQSSAQAKAALLTRALDDDDDLRYIESHPTAGTVLPPNSSEQENNDPDGDITMQDDQVAQPFSPFSSELDWKIAEWAVKDSIGHSSFDRLLAIPGVRFSHCVLSLFLITVVGC